MPNNLYDDPNNACPNTFAVFVFIMILELWLSPWEQPSYVPLWLQQNNDLYFLKKLSSIRLVVL